MDKQDKPLRDWTLGEAQKKCENSDNQCHGCPFNTDDGCRITDDTPNLWSLTDQPRFTEDEVADAKAIMRILGATKIERTEYGGNLCAVIGNIASIVINRDMFSSILPGQSVTISDIIEEESK